MYCGLTNDNRLSRFLRRAVAASTLILLTSSAFAGVIVLKNGSRVEGKITFCDEETCSVTKRRVALEDIARIILQENSRIPGHDRGPGIVLTDGTFRGGRFTGLNLGVVNVDDDEIDRQEVAIIILVSVEPPPPPPEAKPIAPGNPGTTETPAPPGKSAPPPPAQPALILNEVLFLPVENQSPFVEIRNAGVASASLDGVTLRDEKGKSFALPKGGSLAPGALLVIRFDGAKSVEEGVVHAPATDFPGRDAGAIRLTSREGTADAVAWGLNTPRAVELCRGGRCAPPQPGSVVARLPDAATAFALAAWAALDREHATPGQPNPRPPVSVFAALPGTVFLSRPRFSWYGVSGATHYRVLVARGENFAVLVHEAVVAATRGVLLEQLTVYAPELPPGDYFWRVEAVDARGGAAPFSRPVPFAIRLRSSPPVPVARLVSSSLEVLRGGIADSPPAGSSASSDPAVCPGVALGAGEGVCKELAVPVIRHQKDTKMLTLEAPNEEPPMGWDKPDFAGYPYCARAGVAMVNAYYGGKLSQDRIGYEVFSHLPGLGGAEYDLPVVGIINYSTGKYSLPLALGTGGVYHSSPRPFAEESSFCRERNQALRCGQTSACPPCPEELRFHWGYQALKDIKAEIDAGRPLVVTGPGHLYLIVGYVERGEEFSIITQDGGGREEIGLQQNDGEVSNWVDGRSVVTQLDGNEAVSLQLLIDAYWTGLAPVKLGNDEQSLSTDSDGDGVVDFDEVERFGTRMNERDSDGDGVGDKEEIHYSVWDPDHGYHKSVTAFSIHASEEEVAARAENAFREPMELVVDSDNGGCDDGEENDNRDGLREGAETSNFVGDDDVIDEEGKCAQLWTGTINAAMQLGHNHSMTTTVNVRLREVPSRQKRHAIVGAVEFINLVSTGSVITRTHSGNLYGSCTVSGSGSSAALPGAGEISRRVESIGPDGEIRWSASRYILGLAPVRSPDWTKHCSDPKDWTYGQSTWINEGGEGDYSVNIGDAGSDDPQMRTVEDGRMSGSYFDREGDWVSWSICRGGGACPPPPPAGNVPR